MAFSADIKQMFYQVRVLPEHRDYLRYLWWKNNDPDKEVEVRRMTIHLPGAKSSPSVATYALQRCGAAADGIVKDSLKHDFYVDDLLKSMPSVPSSIEFCKNLKSALGANGFQLCKWVSNCEELINQVSGNEPSASDETSLVIDPLLMPSVLGILWNHKLDTLSFNIQDHETTPTRRNILSVVCKLYDPLGITAPVTLEPKIILQEATRLKTGWDEPLPQALQEKWDEWIVDFHKLKSYSVQRCITPPDFSNIKWTELHTFCDASNVAYGACTYIRMIDANNRIHCCLLSGKSRVAPIKSLHRPPT